MTHWAKSWFSILIVVLQPVLGANHALLVGVSEYPLLDRSHWLRGPVNDVALAKEVLTSSRFGFPEKNIQSLSGWPKDNKTRPTRANIKKAFENIASQTSQGDFVFILMSGHGSQQPANKDDSDIETDGLDEIFLPADSSTWDPAAKTVKGAIVDDEIKTWTDSIRKKGATVWIIFDSCHSGTMTRGLDSSNRVNRRIDPSILVPKRFQPAIKSPADKIAIESKSDLGFPKEDSSKKAPLIAMYAAQSLEPTFELPIPPPYGPQRGLFTTTILDIISQAPGALSYRDLAETIDAIYRSNGVMQPTPQIEGDGLDLPVLGLGKAPPRLDVLFTGEFDPKNGFKINAGHLHGINAGTFLEVFPPAINNSSGSLGTVRVSSSKATYSFVKPTAYSGHNASDKSALGVACRAKVLFSELGLAKMAVAIQTKNKEGKWIPAQQAEKGSETHELVKSLSQSSKGLYKILNDSSENADWTVQLEAEGNTSLLPQSGVSKATGVSSISIPNRDNLSESLKKIARARQLLQIAGSRSRGNSLNLDVELMRYDPPGAKEGKAIPYESGGRSLKAGDEIAIQITNKSQVAIDVTLLHIDERFAVTSVFPEPGTLDDNRIPARKTFTTPRLSVSSDKPILEHLVTLAVRATRERQDFSCLEQSSLETTRGTPALDSPLGKLLSSKIYGQGITRGLSRAESGNYGTKLLSWTAYPSE